MRLEPELTVLRGHACATDSVSLTNEFEPILVRATNNLERS